MFETFVAFMVEADVRVRSDLQYTYHVFWKQDLF